MEITGREVLGKDVHAPRLDDSGKETWSYSLVREVRDGDVVLHYEKEPKAITAWSIAKGGFWEAETTWGTPRSTGPSKAPVEPYLREGLWHGLHGPFYLDEPLTLEEIRALEFRIAATVSSLEEEHGKPLYFPFQLRGDGLRAAQGYLTKMPTDLVELLPKLPDLLDDLPVSFPSPPITLENAQLGRPYEPAKATVSQVERDPFSVDPAVVERGLRSHDELQNLLAEKVSGLGFDVREPGPLDPLWDLLWLDGSDIWVAEVKSLTHANEERQLRLGLGQVLIYRQRLRHTHPSVTAVLMVEWRPLDPDWHALCDSLAVRLLWPEAVSALSSDI
ncbi:MAG: hypothetical protein M3335_03340 [Actinomycetota bacterium]|nr:hypothetical protein [Actinomycetota bacterium]